MATIAGVLALALAGALAGCGPAEPAGTSLAVTLGRIKTLDPAFADDLPSATAVGHLYDRLLQYDYAARPYRLVPSMATAMPEIAADGLTVTFTLRDDLAFPPGPGTPTTAAPRIRPQDVVWSLLRLADGRLNASGYWILRGRLVGLDEFNRRTAAQAEGDWSAYEAGIPGLAEAPGNRIRFRLTAPYPQLLHVLAMPYASVLPAAAIRRDGRGLAERPAGSGPFQLESWQRNHRFVLRRNPGYRRERYAGELLPRIDRVSALIVQEPTTAWLLFLQGNLDLSTPGQEQLGQLLDPEGRLLPGLAERGLRLERQAEFQINYIGFNARDPRLGSNRQLRQALSLAYDTPLRIRLNDHRLIPAQGPIPPGVAGYDPGFRNPFARHDLAEARRLLAEAGFPGGIDPTTGRPLVLRFDLGRTDLAARQEAELMVLDLRKLGITVEPALNNAPRFFDKIRRGDVQLFRLNWSGDYPDAQNFFQLFYGPNAGGCNRAAYRNPAFDRLYDAAATLADGPARTALYQQMRQLLVEDCPWIFESHPVAAKLVHGWIRDYIPHHFACDSWKYLGIAAASRQDWQRHFQPFEFRPRPESTRPRHGP
ncbi:MAG: ABC transporter substrate-binding protein [Lentisphaeria bacterium]